MNLVEERKLTGCCGVYCGLCPRYQSKASSRCPGCKVLSLTISCKQYNCCVKKNSFETCAECAEFPCDKYENFFDWDSFVSHKVCQPNIERIKKVGLKKWLGEQNKRRQVLENLLANYNEGRSCSFFCIATALMPADLIKKAENETKKSLANNNIDESDMNVRAKLARTVFLDHATKAGVNLKLRKGSK